MQIPEDLRYTENHEWVRLDADGAVSVGISDYAQDALGDVDLLRDSAVYSVVKDLLPASQSTAPG